MDDDERAQTGRDFAAAVNMAPAELEKWLDTEESRSVGYVDGDNKSGPGGKESVGHASGRRIVEIKRKKKAELTDNDFSHMRKSSATSTATWRKSRAAILPTRAGGTR